jgi:hypothetical protein
MGEGVGRWKRVRGRAAGLRYVLAIAVVGGGIVLTIEAFGKRPAATGASFARPIPPFVYEGPPTGPVNSSPVAPVTVPAGPLPQGSCGSWSSVTNPNVQDLVAEHGQLHNCFEMGASWVMTFVGSPTPVDIAVLSCPGSDIACINGTSDLAARNWKWLAPAVASGLAGASSYSASLLSMNTVAGTALIAANGDTISLDPMTGAYTTVFGGR